MTDKPHILMTCPSSALSKLANAKIDKLEDKIDSTATEMQRIELQKIMVWISPLSFGERHVSVLESVQPGSGKWFLEHSAFVQWVEGRIDRLWCPGIREPPKRAPSFLPRSRHST